MIDPTSAGAVRLRKAIAEQGLVEGSLLKVDDFLNHRVDPVIIDEIGRQIAEHFTDQGWRFEVVDMDGRRIDKLLATPASD